MPVAYMEIGKVEHRSPPGAVDNITDGAPHDKADTPSRERPVGSSRPDEKADAHGDRHRREYPGRQRLVAHQTEADAAVPDDHQTEETVDDRHDGAGLHQVAQQELLGELVGNQGDHDQGHGLAVDASHHGSSPRFAWGGVRAADGGDMADSDDAHDPSVA